MAVHADGRKDIIRVDVTIFASGGNSWHVDEVETNDQGDKVRSFWELRVRAHRNEKLAVVVWSDAAWANGKDLFSTVSFFSGVATTRYLARCKVRCDSDSSQLWKIETKSKIEFERRGAGIG